MNRAALLLLLLALPLGAADAPLPKAPDSFRVELVLAAPEVEAPTALCVAPNGDLYYAEDPMDMGGPPTKNIDRIWVLKGGDPKRKHLVADQLWAVMGLELVGNQLYVVHAPYVSVFTLGPDGLPTGRRDLFTDLGPPVAGLPSFNDHIPSGIRMGMDGWLYVSVGDKGIPRMTRREPGAVHVAEGRERRTKTGNHISLEGGGVVRFRPDGSGLEVFASGTRNHLDVVLDEQDRIFVRDNTDDGHGWWTRLMYLPPGGFLGYPWAHKVPGAALPMIRDFGGGSPCGGWCYLDDGLPETYRGRVFHCEWGQGKIAAVKLAQAGAGFRFVDQLDFLLPNGVPDFRPFSLRPTADGRGFYVTDWGHSGWLAKVKAGRIWKVTYTGTDVQPKPRGRDTDSLADLVRALGHPAHTERLRAQRALTARGEAAIAPVVEALREGTAPPATYRHGLWVLRDLGWDTWPKLTMQVTRDQNDAIIFNAIRVLASYDPKAPGADAKTAFWIASEFITILDGDDNAGNRMLAAAGLERVATTKWLRDIVWELGKEKDPYVRAAAIRTLRRATDWNDFRTNERGAMLQPLARFADWDEGMREGLFETLAGEFDPGAVAILERLAYHDQPKVRARALAALAQSGRDRKPYAGTWWGMQPAGHRPPPRDVAWEGTPLVRSTLLAGLGDKEATVRQAAVAGLLLMSDPESLEPLTVRFAAETDAAVRLDLLRTVAGLRAPRGLEFLQKQLADVKNPEALRTEAAAGLEGLTLAAGHETLARVAASSQEPAALRTRAVRALGTNQSTALLGAAAACLVRESPLELRRATAEALGRVNDPKSVRLLLEFLKAETDEGALSAALRSLTALPSREAVPVLLPFAAREATAFEATLALAAVPDVRALSAYVNGLTSRNADLRQACRRALTAVRNEAAPALEQLAVRNELRPETLPALREVYSAFTPITSWHVVGPFPRTGKAHPPETAVDLKATYPGAEKAVSWQAVRTQSQEGRLNAAALFRPSEQMEMYAYAEVESPSARDAALRVGSDDTVVVWLNGKKVHEFLSNRGWAPDQDRVAVRLEAGRNRLLVRCGNSGGPWELSVAVSGATDRYGFLKGAAPKFDLAAYRDFATKTPGDAERGGKLFHDAKGLACVKCHSVGSTGGQVGPDLAGIGMRYGRAELIASVLEPSKTIAQGYETVVVVTRQGKTLTGVFKGETADEVRLADAEGKVAAVAKKDIEERSFSPVSLMPNGLAEGMTPRDFADVIAYLAARREETGPARK